MARAVELDISRTDEAAAPAVIAPEQQPEGSAEPRHSRMEVVSANGRRVIVDGEVDVSKLVEIVRGLETLR